MKKYDRLDPEWAGVDPDALFVANLDAAVPAGDASLEEVLRHYGIAVGAADEEHPDAACGVRRLLATMLNDAIRDYLGVACGIEGYNKAAQRARLQREAAAWFESDDEADVFTFVGCCRALQLSPSAVRAKVFALAARPAALHGNGGPRMIRVAA